MSVAPYTIYAIQYAHRKTNSTELFYHDYHNTRRWRWIILFGR